MAKKVAKKRSTTKRKSPKRVAAGKKAARTRKRNLSAKKSARKAAPKRRKSTTRRRKSTRARTVIVRIKANPSKKKAARRRKSRVSRQSFLLKPAPRKRATAYRLKRTARKSRKGRKYFTYAAKRNPLSAIKSSLKSGALLWGGIVGIRVLNNLLKQHVVPKLGASLPASLVPVLPAVASFGIATLLLPKVLKGKSELVGKLQLGATIALCDSVFNTFVKGNLPANVQGLLSGAGVGEYVPQLGEYYSPRAQLGEYVDEGLSSDEAEYLQTGGAGGSLARTAFSV